MRAGRLLHRDPGQVTITGRRRAFYGNTRKEVQAWIRATVNESERGIVPARGNLSLEKYLAQWLEDVVRHSVARAASPPRAERREHATYDAETVKRLWRSVAGTRWLPFLVLAIKTGLRQGELLGLKWVDFDFVRSALQVRRQLQRDKTLQPTKGRRSRRLDLGEIELAVLREHRARQDERRQNWGEAWEGQDLAFCTDRGRPLGWRDTYRDFRNIMRKAGLESIRFHDLRHTNATLLLEQGVHPKVVQERLGHSDIGVTLDTYSHVTPTMGRDAAKRLDDLLDEGETALVENPQAGPT